VVLKTKPPGGGAPGGFGSRDRDGSDTEDKSRQGRKQSTKRFVAPGEVPHGVLRLNEDRAQRLRRWRRAISTVCAEHPRALRIVMAIEWLFKRAGYCHASDTFLVNETNMARNKVQAALLHLEVVGAVIRVHEINGNRTRRLIYPCNRILMHPAVRSWSI
jgi:hypothetical protein